MENRPVSNTGLQIAPLSLGTWAMGGEVDTWGHVDDRESIAAIHATLDSGIVLIDTAPSYGAGHAEEIVGKALRGRRHEALIATKCGFSAYARGEQPKRSLRRDDILRQCEQSLRRLHTDRIDLYQCHWPDPQTPIRETMGALIHLWEQGDIRAIGLCNFSSEQVRSALEFGPVHAVQLPFSLLHARAAFDLVPFCAEHEIAVLACGPLARGLLTGKFGPEDAFEDLRARDAEFQGNRFRRNLRIVDELRQIAAGVGRTPAQLAINWVANFPGITTAIFGAKRQSQVSENLAAAGWTISAQASRQIDDLVGGPPRDK